MRCEYIAEEQVKRLCIKAREILIEEANVQVIDSPVTVRPFDPSRARNGFLIGTTCSDMWGYPWPVF
jgi:hypothetical protein